MYKLLLIRKYLFKRRIAWWALFAVALCTMMVLVVISVMGGWLSMARLSFRGLSGDLLIEGDSINGFPNYQAIIDRVKREKDVMGAVPMIRTFGLININDEKPSTVQILGLPIDQVGNVNEFPESLYRQYQMRIDAANALLGDKSAIFEYRQYQEGMFASVPEDGPLSPAERDDAARDAASPQPAPSFDLIRDSVSTAHAQLPAAARLLGDFAQPPIDRAVVTPGKAVVKVDESGQPTVIQPPPTITYMSRLTFDPTTATLTFTGRMTADTRDWLLGISKSTNFFAWLDTRAASGQIKSDDRAALLKLSDDPNWPGAVRALYATAVQDGVDYVARRLNNPIAQNWPGMIGGTGVLEISRDKDGNTVGRSKDFYDDKHELYVKMTVLKFQPDKVDVAANDISDDRFWIVDDSHTKVWQYDTAYVYVPFDRLQADVGMDEQHSTSAATGQPIVEPARCTEVDVKCKPGIDLEAIKESVQEDIDRVWAVAPLDASLTRSLTEPHVHTWEEKQALWLGAIENEKSLVTFLFGIVSIVAIFLIFCIFYMIVMEKTRDIGIIKSIGGTSGGIAAIFLGYGLVVGVVGAGVGLLGAYGLVHNINQIHGWMSRQLGITIWDPRVYAFDTIPNTMNVRETAIIVVVAVVSSVAGALLPAIRAARMNPIEAIRWE